MYDPSQQAALDAAIAAAAANQQTAQQAAMINAAYMNNQMPVLPAQNTTVGYTPAQKQDTINEAQKYAVFNNPASVNPATLPEGMQATYAQQMRQAASERPPSAAAQAIAYQYGLQHNANVSTSGTMYPVNGGYYNKNTGEMFRPNVTEPIRNPMGQTEWNGGKGFEKYFTPQQIADINSGLATSRQMADTLFAEPLAVPTEWNGGKGFETFFTRGQIADINAGLGQSRQMADQFFAAPAPGAGKGTTGDPGLNAGSLFAIPGMMAITHGTTASLTGIRSFFDTTGSNMNTAVPLLAPQNTLIGGVLEGVATSFIASAYLIPAGFALLTQPGAIISGAIPGLTQQGSQLIQQAEKDPLRTTGNILGMAVYGEGVGVGGKYISRAIPSVVFDMSVPTGTGPEYAGKEYTYFNDLYSKIPGGQTLFDRVFGGRELEFSNTNRYTGVKVGNTVLAYARGAEVTPDIAMGNLKTGGAINAEANANIPLPGAKYSLQPAWIGAEQDVYSSFLTETAYDPFTKSMATVQFDLDRAAVNLGGKYVPGQLAGSAVQIGVPFDTAVKVMSAVQQNEGVIGGSQALNGIWLPEGAGRDIINGLTGKEGSSDIDLTAPGAKLNPLLRDLTAATAGSPLKLQTQTVFDINMKYNAPGVIGGMPNLELFAPYRTPQGVYQIPTGYSAHSLPGSTELSPESIAALTLLVKQTGASGLFEIANYEHGLSIESEKVPFTPANPLGTYQHAALSPGSQQGIYQGISSLGRNAQLIGSFNAPDLWGSRYFPDVSHSDLDIDIARSSMLTAADRFGESIRANQPPPNMSLIPPSANIDTSLLLGLSEQGQNIGFGGRPMGGVIPTAAPTPRGVHISEVGLSTTTDRIIGTQEMERTFGVRTAKYPSIGGDILAQTPESYILSALSRSFGESKKGVTAGYWEYNPATGKTRLVSTSPKLAKDLPRMYAASKGLAVTALEAGNLGIASRYYRMATAFDYLGKENSIDVNAPIPEDITAGRNIPAVSSDMEPLMAKDRLPAFTPETDPPHKFTMTPEDRRIRFGIHGTSETGVHPIEFFQPTEIETVPSITGGSVKVVGPVDISRNMLSRIIAPNAATKPASFTYTPETKMTTVSLSLGDKTLQAMLDLRNSYAVIAKTAYQNRYYDLGKAFETHRNAVDIRFEKEFGEPVANYLDTPDILIGVPRGPINPGLILGVDLGLGTVLNEKAETYPASTVPRNEEPYPSWATGGTPYRGFAATAANRYPASAPQYPTTRTAATILLDYPGAQKYPEGKYPGNELINYAGYPGGGDYPPDYPIGGGGKYPPGYPPNYPPNYPPDYPPNYPPNYPPGYPPDYPPGPPSYPPHYPPHTPPPWTPPTTTTIITDTIPHDWQISKRRKRPARFLELFSFEEGTTTPVPTRFGLGGVNPRATGQHPARFMELLSLEQGTTSAVPERFGRGGVNTFAQRGNPKALFIPGYRGYAGNILNPDDIAPQGLFDIAGPGVRNAPKRRVTSYDRMLDTNLITRGDRL